MNDEKAVTFDDSAWDGSPGNWDTAEAYCRDCLIDENTETPKTKDKCALPYRKPGSKAINRNALRTMATGRGVMAVSASREAKVRAARWIARMWPQAFDKPAPDNIRRLAGLQTKATLFKDRQGELWFIGISSNNFEDREDEIISNAAHEDFVSWLKETGVRPPIVFMHRPRFPDAFHMAHYLGLVSGKLTAEEYNENLKTLYKATAIATAETAFVLDGFVFVVGRVLNDKRELAEKLISRQKTWGMSHGFIPIKIDDNIIEKYRSFEFSVLPIEIAANKLTAIGFSEEKMDTMLKELSDEDRELLEQVLGDETDTKNALARARDILSNLLASKAMDETEEVPEDEEPTEETPVEEEEVVEKSYAELRVKLFSDFQLEELASVLTGVGEQLKTQQETIARLEAQVKELTRTEDERVAAQFIAPQWNIFSNRGETEEETGLVEKLKSNIPDKIVEEKELDATNPLSVGFWSHIAS